MSLQEKTVYLTATNSRGPLLGVFTTHLKDYSILYHVCHRFQFHLLEYMKGNTLRVGKLNSLLGQPNWAQGKISQPETEHQFWNEFGHDKYFFAFWVRNSDSQSMRIPTYYFLAYLLIFIIRNAVLKSISYLS